MEDAPVDLLRAISHANKILDWYENLITEEIPEEWIWPFDDLLDEHFKELRISKQTPGTKDADNLTEVPMMDNELANTRGRR